MIIVAEGAMSRDGKPITSDQIKKVSKVECFLHAAGKGCDSNSWMLVSSSW